MKDKSAPRRQAKLKTRLSFTVASVVLLTVALISLLSNIFINGAFTRYVSAQLKRSAAHIVEDVSAQYDRDARTWDMALVHTVGMAALYDGYIVRVVDDRGQVLWDAEACDMAACMRVMDEITARMHAHYPLKSGEFTRHDYALTQAGDAIGTVSISYYGPYFLSDNDFQFLATLNTVFVAVGAASLMLSVLIGTLLSKRISTPLEKTVEAAKRMAGGDYSMRIAERNVTRELDDLAGTVNHLAETLSRQEYLRKQLTADVSHELRTPLTSVETHLEAMIDGLWAPTTERLTACHEEVLRIGVLVKDLEGLAHADSASVTLDRQPVNLKNVLDKTLPGFAAELEKKGLAVTTTGDAPIIQADEDRLCQVAANLLSNAIKYTEPGGHIALTLSARGAFAVLTVTDDGIGIPEDDLPFIFERFYRADKSRNRKTGGSGIGLAVAKSIVDAHGGTITAESTPGVGSRFTVLLPIGGAQA